MTMTRAEQARRLLNVAIVLENESEFYNRYVNFAPKMTAEERRGCVRDAALKYVGRNGEEVTYSDFIVVAGEPFMSREYLRRYFDDIWDIPSAANEADDPRARRAVSFPFEFWLERELNADQVCAHKTPQSQPQPTKEQPIMLTITTKTLINGEDIAKKTNDELFEAIAQAEIEIARLQAIKAKPKALLAKIADLQLGIAALVAHMDAKV